MSVPRADAAAAVVGDHMFVYGGFGGGRRHNSVESFDTLSEVWEAQPAMAHERLGAGAAVIRGRIHVVGGSAGSGVTTTFAEHFDGAWTTVPPMIPPRCLCTTAVIAEKLYVCGGQGGRTHITVERFDPTHETWELLRPTLHRRKDTTMAVLRDRLYVVGGMDDDDTALNSVTSCDPDTDSWEESSPMLDACSKAKVARVGGCINVTGGGARNAHGGLFL